jgi:hypothetical protein
VRPYLKKIQHRTGGGWHKVKPHKKKGGRDLNNSYFNHGYIYYLVVEQLIQGKLYA